MPAKPDEPQTLVHFTSGRNGEKHIETEVVKPGSASSQFLQRMEKNKQSIPCYQIVDLRTKVTGDLYEYEYQGLIHFLDSPSIELFENLLPRYHYIYTQDIYKIILTSILKSKKLSSPPLSSQKINDTNNKPEIIKDSVKRELIPETLLKAPVTIIPFGYHLHQNEIRMLYISAIKIKADESSQWLDAKTVNISVSGIKIKSLQNLKLKEGQLVEINFIGITEKFNIDFPKINYKVINIRHHQEHQVCCLLRTKQSTQDKFSSSISNFINNNKRRYKIDLDDFIESIKSRVFERIYSSNCEFSSIFIHKIDSEIKLKHLLCNEHFDPSKNNIPIVLSTLSSHLEILNWDKNNNTPQNLNIYSFTIELDDGQNQIYCALDSMFKNKEEKQSFLKIAHASNTFKGWQLIIQPCELLEQSIADTSLADLEEISIAESERLQTELKTIIATGKLIDASRSLSLEAFDLNVLKQEKPIQLSQFLCPNKEQEPIAVVKVAQQKQRNENRYFLTTSVTLQIYSKVHTGQTLDFSPSGIKLELEEPLVAELRDTVDVSFPGLQKKFVKEKLEKQHFRIAHISSDGLTVCLSRDRRFVLHEASLFFRRLIDSNPHKLTQCSGDTYMIVRSILFEKLMVRNLVSVPFFVSLENSILKASYISANENPNDLLWSFHQSGNYHFDSIFSGSIWKKILNYCTLNSHSINVIFETEIFLCKYTEEDRWEISLSEDFSTSQALKKHITRFNSMPYRKALQLSITPSESYDQNLILDELNEIRNNSKNQCDQLIEQLQSIQAVGELIDITSFYKT